MGLDNARALWPDLSCAATAEVAVTGADIVLATEWPEYLALDPRALAAIARGRTVIDARNRLDAAAWRPRAGPTAGSEAAGRPPGRPPDLDMPAHNGKDQPS